MPVVVLVVLKVNGSGLIVDIIYYLATVEVIRDVWLAVIIVVWIHVIQDPVVVVIWVDVVCLSIIVFVVLEVYSASLIIDVIDDLSYNGQVRRAGEFR